MTLNKHLRNGKFNLEISQVHAGYGNKRVLEDISFQAKSGELTGLLGSNGCGKTTLLRVLCRQLPYTGDIWLCRNPGEKNIETAQDPAATRLSTDKNSERADTENAQKPACTRTPAGKNPGQTDTANARKPACTRTPVGKNPGQTDTENAWKPAATRSSAGRNPGQADTEGTAGRHSLKEYSSRELARQISYIPQRSGIAISLSVLDVVLMGFNPVLGLLEHPSKAQETLANQALEKVGMENQAETDYQKLSEGQKQLCILARTLIEDALLLLLDEPESSLDFPHRHLMMKQLLQMVQGEKQKAALVTLHDPYLALEYCDRLVLLKEGRCVNVLEPRRDSLSHMEKALSEIYGPIQLKSLESHGKMHFIMLP